MEGAGLGGGKKGQCEVSSFEMGVGLARWPVWPEPSEGQEGRRGSQQATSGRRR